MHPALHPYQSAHQHAGRRAPASILGTLVPLVPLAPLALLALLTLLTLAALWTPNATAQVEPADPVAGSASAQGEAADPLTESAIAQGEPAEPVAGSASEAGGSSSSTTADSLFIQVRNVIEPSDGTTVLHFHATERCADCILIETYARDAIEEEFVSELEDGQLTFRLINIDEPRNAPLREYYDIDDTMVVLTRWRDGQQLEWMALWEVWDYVEDPLSMGLYVTDEVFSYLEKDEREREEAAVSGHD